MLSYYALDKLDSIIADETYQRPCFVTFSLLEPLPTFLLCKALDIETGSRKDISH